jgi:alpha-beta hydrolase superfamily lysophospholipase
MPASVSRPVRTYRVRRVTLPLLLSLAAAQAKDSFAMGSGPDSARPPLPGTPGEIRTIASIRFEYADAGEGTPLMVMVPGYTQHNRSPEFTLLRDHFLAEGMSVLIMNPPQHGEDIQWSAKIYDWGRREALDLEALTDSLDVFASHPRVHALGFSIGAKTIIRFAALPRIRSRLASVIAVAPPYRVSDINKLLSGDLRSPFEGLISGGVAQTRAGFFRGVYMWSVGMTRMLAVNRASPALEAPEVRAPLLLAHGSGDWLIRANHSRRIYEGTGADQSVDLVILDSHSHAEDMLSLDESSVRQGLLDVMDAWMRLADAGGGASPRDSLGARFDRILDTVPWVRDHRVPVTSVSLLDHPTLFRPWDRLWYSAPEASPYLAGLHYSGALAYGADNRIRVDAAPWSGRRSWLRGWSAALSLADTAGTGEFKDPEASLSYSHPFGSVLMLRRLGFLSGMGEDDRRILSMDLCLYALDFQADYGTFSPHRGDAELSISLPLIADYASSFFLGAGYSGFPARAVEGYDRDAFQAFLVWGPPRPIRGTRARLDLRYFQKGFFSDGWSPRLAAGMSLYFRER